MAKNKTLELSIKIAGQVDKSLTTAINNTNTLMGSLTTTMSKVGTAGLAAMGALTATTVAGLVACTKEAAKYENYMSDVVKVVDGLANASGKVTSELAENGKTFAENYSEMKETLKDLSTQIPYTFEDLTQLAAAAGQSGKSFEDLTQTDFLKDIAMWGSAMDISADQAGEWGAKWEQAFSMSHEQVMDLADVINYLGNNYATTSAEIAQSVNDSAAMGQLLGVDPSATAAIAASMQAMGVSSDKVGTTVARIYTNISKGTNATKAQQEMWQELGFTAEGIAKAMQPGGDSIGTLTKVFEAINAMPGERKMAALNTLFGQWAIEGGAKVTQNLSLLTGMLEEIQNENIWTDSMEKEFMVKAETPEAIETMLGSSIDALKDDIGSAMLPAYKSFGLAMIDFIGKIRKSMPELEQLAGTLGELASNGVEKLADALERALPYIQKGLDYLANNGENVVSVLGKLAAVFAGMKFAPGIASILGSAGNLPLGSIKSLFTGGQKAGSTAGGLLSAFSGASSGNGFFRTLSTTLSSLINGNGISGTTGLLSAAASSPGLISGYQSVGSVLKNGIASSGIGQYFSGIFSSAGNLGSTLGNTKAGGAISGLLSNLTLPLRKGIAGVGAAATIQGSVIQQSLSGILGNLTGKAGGLISGITNSGAGQAIGGVLSSIGGVAKSGLGVLGSVWGPIASGFGSIFAGAAPVIGVISAIIAVVSILGDNLDGIRGIVENVFGEQGVAIFDKFVGVLQNVGDFISGLFVDGGVAAALAPLQEVITNLFGEDAGVAFGGLTAILQSVMGVIGQIVDFATTTVKPIIQDVFGFLTGTVVPIILQTFTAAAPSIAGVISGLGSAIVTGMQLIGSAIRACLPIVQTIITVILSIASVAAPAVLAGLSTLAEGIGPILEGIKTVFDGLISFITGIFTRDWEEAWEGVKQVFGGIFDGLGALLKTPLNAVISAINGIRITVPDWDIFGSLAGKEFGFDLPLLKYGGFTTGPSIAGEAGTEAVISFQSAARAQNIATWEQAGRMLGVLDTLDNGNTVELKDVDTGGGDTGAGSFTFAPNIIIQGNADEDTLEEALRRAKEEFEAWYEQMMRRKARTAY